MYQVFFIAQQLKAEHNTRAEQRGRALSSLDILLALRHTYFPEICPLINELEY